MGRSRDRGSIRGVLVSIASRVDEWTLVRRGYDTSRAVDGIERDAVGLVSKIRFVLGIILAGLLCVLPGNPYDGHTLRDVIEDTQKLTGCEIERGYVDQGYRGHDTQNPRRVFISGQKRGAFGIIKRELRRRSAIEPVIGHLKAEDHLGRCYLKGRAGDAANAVLSAVGYNFRRILAWLRALLRLFLIAILRLLISRSTLIPAS